ncbi:DUF2147 domain-containing protein [Flagellimonas olearia]|uniref:DUF2147 domain-containing protein n=1 Tax=Flagellimonas olearia TaxID=552546 RepID=A0A6I1E546_9FLAO|nr:DUF2147 domain-containing protein [Allomuricauda olearia]KAB7530995.1 DUF2147 domain-containing protein [Allomuricauda olearia]
MKGTKMFHKCFFVLTVLAFQNMWSQSVFGKWKTVDDRSGATKAIVEIYRENGMLQARIIDILEKGKKNALCTKCKGKFKNQPVLGMKIFQNLIKNDKDEYKGTNMLDPEHGMTFRGKLWLHPEDMDKLMVRGYLAFLYRTQTWHRVKEE